MSLVTKYGPTNRHFPPGSARTIDPLTSVIVSDKLAPSLIPSPRRKQRKFDSRDKVYPHRGMQILLIDPSGCCTVEGRKWIRPKSHVCKGVRLYDSRRSAGVARPYRVLFDRNVAGIILTKVDGRIVDCNEPCARIFGFASRKEMLARRAWEFYFYKAEREILLERLRTQRTCPAEEVCLRGRNGLPVWVLSASTVLSTSSGYDSYMARLVPKMSGTQGSGNRRVHLA